jgi:carbonic anhydrase/acetyltransferase-like protein (isoleucine patch superfamily)
MIYALGECVPRIARDCFIAPNATLIGSVILEEEASVWFNVVIRADTDVISIGPRSNIQDGSVLHIDAGKPLTVGADVTVGHRAILHGCTIGARCLIGINAVVLNEAVIGAGCLIGANALVTEGMQVPEGSVVMGTPGKIVRTLTAEQREQIYRVSVGYVANARRFRDQLREFARE